MIMALIIVIKIVNFAVVTIEIIAVIITNKYSWKSITLKKEAIATLMELYLVI